MRREATAILLICAVLGVSGCLGFGQTVIRRDVAVAGCCQTDDGCASGQGVTQASCAADLQGTWNAGKVCNTITAKCE